MEWILFPLEGKFYYIVVSLKERGGGVLNFVKSQKAAK